MSSVGPAEVAGLANGDDGLRFSGTKATAIDIAEAGINNGHPESPSPFCSKSKKCIKVIPRTDAGITTAKPRLAAVLPLFARTFSERSLPTGLRLSEWRAPALPGGKSRYRLTLAKTGRLLI